MEWKCTCHNNVNKIEDLCPMCQFEYDEWQMEALENQMEGRIEAMSDHFDLEVEAMMEDMEAFMMEDMDEKEAG